MRLTGIESSTLELDGSISTADARRLAGDLPLEGLRDHRVRARVLFFAMTGLHVRGLGRPAFDYNEALWMVGVAYGGALAWFAIACDLDHRVIRSTGAILVRYPVRRATIEIAGAGEALRFDVRVPSGSRFSVRATPEAGHPSAVPPRRVVVRSTGRLYEIPWNEEPAPERVTATCTVAECALGQETLGASVDWESRGLVHRGRRHTCGLARLVR